MSIYFSILFACTLIVVVSNVHATGSLNAAEKSELRQLVEEFVGLLNKETLVYLGIAERDQLMMINLKNEASMRELFSMAKNRAANNREHQIDMQTFHQFFSIDDKLMVSFLSKEEVENLLRERSYEEPNFISLHIRTTEDIVERFLLELNEYDYQVFAEFLNVKNSQGKSQRMIYWLLFQPDGTVDRFPLFIDGAILPCDSSPKPM